jgi:hypothetical protein
MTITAISSIIFDSADPAALAAFYARATGGRVTDADPDFTTVGGGAAELSFQRVDGYRGPGWPAAKHLHLDFRVADVATAVKELVDLGATLPDLQPGGEDWTVLLDPEGHPFCVSAG